MKEEVILDSASRILDVGVIGAVCLLLMAVVIVRERYWQSEMATERQAHAETRSALLDEVRSNGETVALMRQQMQSQNQAFETLMRMVRKDS